MKEDPREGGSNRGRMDLKLTETFRWKVGKKRDGKDLDTRDPPKNGRFENWAKEGEKNPRGGGRTSGGTGKLPVWASGGGSPGSNKEQKGERGRKKAKQEQKRRIEGFWEKRGTSGMVRMGSLLGLMKKERRSAGIDCDSKEGETRKGRRGRKKGGGRGAILAGRKKNPSR